MKIKYLLVSLVVLFVPLLALASLDEFKANCSNFNNMNADCPKIIVNVQVINDGAGELTTSNFYYHIKWGGNIFGDYQHSMGHPFIDEHGIKGTETPFVIQMNSLLNDSVYPIPYKVYTLGSSDIVYGVEGISPGGNTFGIDPNLYGESLLRPYWTWLSEGGAVSLSEGCSGTIEYGQTKYCKIAFNDGDIKYGYHYEWVKLFSVYRSGYYKETIVPISTPCTYKNRALFKDNNQGQLSNLITAPIHSVEDNIAGCPLLETFEQMQQRIEQEALKEQVKQEIRQENQVIVQPIFEQLQQEVQTTTSVPVISEDPIIIALQAQITELQRQIIALLTKLIQLLQARLASL